MLKKPAGESLRKKPATEDGKAEDEVPAASFAEVMHKDRKKDLEKAVDLANTAKDPLMANILKRSINVYNQAVGNLPEPKKAKTASFDVYSEMVQQDPVVEGDLKKAVLEVKKSPSPAEPVKAKPAASEGGAKVSSATDAGWKRTEEAALNGWTVVYKTKYDEAGKKLDGYKRWKSPEGKEYREKKNAMNHKPIAFTES